MLLIVAALGPRRPRRLHVEARALDLDVLVEVHDERELEAALEIDADVIGINNRDLTDFEVDLERTLELLAHVPAGKTVVSESGYSTREQLDELDAVGVDAVLVGETLMRADDVEAACRALTGLPEAEPRQRRSFNRGLMGHAHSCAAMTSPKRAPFLAFVSALLGGAIVAVLLVAFGAVGSNSTKTVVQQAPLSEPVQTRAARAASPPATSTSATPPASPSSGPTSCSRPSPRSAPARWPSRARPRARAS